MDGLNTQSNVVSRLPCLSGPSQGCHGRRAACMRAGTTERSHRTGAGEEAAVSRSLARYPPRGPPRSPATMSLCDSYRHVGRGMKEVVGGPAERPTVGGCVGVRGSGSVCGGGASRDAWVLSAGCASDGGERSELTSWENVRKAQQCQHRHSQLLNLFWNAVLEALTPTRSHS